MIMGRTAYLRHASDPSLDEACRFENRPASTRRSSAAVAAPRLAPRAAARRSSRSHTRLARALACRTSHPPAAAIAFDLSTGDDVFAQEPTPSPLAPASNEKLPSPCGALRRSARPTGSRPSVCGHGHQTGSTSGRDSLILEGLRRPGAVRAPSWPRLAAQVRDAGITRVTGAIVGDETFFDTGAHGPGWKASFYIERVAPAVGADRRPRPLPGLHLAQARARRRAALPDELVAAGVEGRTGAPARRADPSVAARARSVSRPAAGSCARWIGRATTSTAEIVREALRRMEPTRARRRQARRVVRQALRRRNVPLARASHRRRLRALSAYDRLTAKTTARLLRSAFADGDISSAFVDSLPTAGVNGTLVRPDDERAGVSKRLCQDGDDGLRLRPLRLRALALRLLDPDERQPDSLVVCPPRPRTASRRS